ncbi:MAG: S-layer protein [Cyanobacteria bacterium P01_E01_bin.48]
MAAAAMKYTVLRRTFALSLSLGLAGSGLAIAPVTPLVPGLMPAASAQTLPKRLAWTIDYAAALENQTDIGLRRQSLGLTLTRIEFAQWLTEFFGFTPDPTRIVPVTDVDEDTPDYWTIQAVLQANAMRAYEADEFRLEGDMTKLEALAIFARVLELPAPNAEDIESWMELYDDATDLPEVGRTFVTMAAQAGLILNVPDSQILDANLILSRGEGAAMLHQALAYRQRVRSLNPPVAQLAPTQPEKPQLFATRIQPESGNVPAGSELIIEAQATAGARASATVARRPVPMREVDPGVYRGVYRVSSNDAITSPAISIELARDGASTRVQRQLPQLTIGSTAPSTTSPTTTALPPARPDAASRPDTIRPTGPEQTATLPTSRPDAIRPTLPEQNSTLPSSRPDATRPTLPEQSASNSLPPIGDDRYPTFTAIRITPSRDLQAGERFTVAIQGSPGGLAQFDVGSLAQNVTMKEVQPGLYEGFYTIAADDQADSPFIQVVMSKNGLGVRHRELFPHRIDGTPSLLAPINTETPAPRVTPIVQPSQATPSPATPSETPIGGGGSEPRIFAASFNGVNRELREDDILRVTMRGDRGGQASFQIVDVTPSVDMQEISPGFYEGKVRIDRSTPVVADGELQLTLELNGRRTGIASNDPVNIRP